MALTGATAAPAGARTGSPQQLCTKAGGTYSTTFGAYRCVFLGRKLPSKTTIRRAEIQCYNNDGVEFRYVSRSAYRDAAWMCLMRFD